MNRKHLSKDTDEARQTAAFWTRKWTNEASLQKAKVYENKMNEANAYLAELEAEMAEQNSQNLEALKYA
jgi:hypothetical protein